MSLVVVGKIIGYVALFVEFSICLSIKRSRILFFRFLGDFLWSLNFLFLGFFTGAVLNLIGVLRECVFACRNKYKWADHLIWPIMFAVIMTASPVLEWVKMGRFTLPPLFAGLGSLFIVIGLYGKKPFITRLWVGGGQIFWLFYNIFGNGEIPNVTAVIGSSLGLASALIGTLRELWLIKHPQKEEIPE